MRSFLTKETTRIHCFASHAMSDFRLLTSDLRLKMDIGTFLTTKKILLLQINLNEFTKNGNDYG